MTSVGGLTGFWIITLLTLLAANMGETQKNYLNEPDIPFPPACPKPQNIAAICNRGQGRPRYPASFFPGSSLSHFRRRGNAINLLESWYSLCCREQLGQQSSWILCCAQQAWKQALSMFCEEEHDSMTPQYECCEDRGETQWTCLNSNAPNPNYNPTPGYTAPQLPQETTFTFNANAC